MQYLDDDMSELFRKASEDIRLRAENDDWDKIQKKLLPNVSTLTGVIPSAVKISFNKRNNYRLWIYAFIILAFSRGAGILLGNGIVARIDTERLPGSSRVFKSERKSAGKNNSVILRAKSNSLLTSSEQFKANKFSLLPVAELRNAEQIHFDMGEQLEKNEVALKFNLFKNSESNKKQTAILKSKTFFIGFIAGPQFSQTKQLGFSNAGLSAGLLIGFHLDTKLTIESGLILSNKYYASAGEFFDMSKLSATMPSGMKLIQVQSKTNMMEIPINIKYDLIKIKKGHLFVSSGISSYILTNENNQYQATLNGNRETMTGNYSRHQNYFAAAFNISAGYEFRAVKNASLRIEPYFQIPMKTIGMGSMHVVSTGVYLGITFPVVK